jgi:hypothetical protein
MIAVVVITALLSFMAGVATESFKQWIASWFVVRGIRKAIQAEMQGVLVQLNFYLLDVMQDGGGEISDAKYFTQRWTLESFEYYWQNQREALLKLPEWPRLKNWNAMLGQIITGGHPALFNVMMLFESLTIPPLDKCLHRDSRIFVQNVLARPEVAEYKGKYFRHIISASRVPAV